MHHFRSIHYLRAIAAIMVAVFHIFSNVEFMSSYSTPVYWLNGGVDIFFIISGFVMMQSTSSRAITPGQFMTQRAIRIVPLYWIATLAVMIQIQGRWELKVKSLLFLPAYNPKVDMMQPVLEPGWTLNYEMFFYVVFALSLFLAKRYRFPVVAIVLCSLVSLGLLIEFEGAAKFYVRPIILEFLFGMVIAKYGLKLPVIAVPAGFALMYFMETLHLDRLFEFGIPAILIVCGALSAEKYLPQWKVADLLGSASYSIYIFHVLILSVLAKIWTFIDLGNGAFLVFAVSVILLAGCGIYYALEKPIIAYFASLKAGKAEKPISNSA
jgi:exopolysaccharide production protein ExoZ